MAASREARETFLTFRVNETERREIQLLTRAEGVSRSELLRRLVKERVRKVTGGPGDGADSP